MTPFFTIIVVSLNAETTIGKTIQSILTQTFGNYEIVVKDGNSRDSTVSQVPPSDKIRIHQSGDSGIYDAMNQAIQLSTGQYLCFLNCGDVFASNDVLQKVFDGITKQLLICHPIVAYSDYRRNGIVFRSPRKMSDFYLYRTPLNHQTMFVAKEIFAKHGMFTTTLAILADHELTMRLYKAKVHFLYVDVVSCDYLGGGMSELQTNYAKLRRESAQIRGRYFSRVQLVVYGLVILLSAQKVREWIISDSSPKLLRVAYRGVVNIINRL